MYQRKDKTWQDQLPIPGTKKYKYFYGKTKAEVKAKMAAWQAEQDSPLLFSQAADAWDNYHASKVTHNANAVYGPCLKRAKDYFGTDPMMDITPDQIQAFIKQIASQGYARRTVQMHRDMLNMIFDHAITQPGSPLKYNPCSSVRIPSGLSQTRREPPTDSQLALIKPEGFGLFAYFLLYTGLRRGELLALRWEDIDFKNNIIHVNKSVSYESNQPVVKAPKTEAGKREVDLLDVLAEALPRGKKGYVFGGEKPLTKIQFRKQWLNFCRSIGQVEEIKTKHKAANKHEYTSTQYKPLITPHQFRHAYASMLDDAGIDETAAKDILGHSSIVVTKDVYTHIRSKKRERSAAALNKFIADGKK